MEKGREVGACHYCGKRGHYQRDCWLAQQAGKGKGEGKRKDSGKDKGKGKDKSKDKGKEGKKTGKVAAVVADEATPWERQPRSEEWHGWADDGSWLEAQGDSEHCSGMAAGVRRGKPIRGEVVLYSGTCIGVAKARSVEDGLVDSGAVVHLIPDWLGDDKKSKPRTVNSLLRSATGEIINQYGARLVPIISNGVTLTQVKCVVAEVAHPILSVSALIDAGHAVRFEGAGATIRFSTGEECVSLLETGIASHIGVISSSIGAACRETCVVGEEAEIEREATWAKPEDMADEAEALCEDAPEERCRRALTHRQLESRRRKGRRTNLHTRFTGHGVMCA
eukprot:6057817-Amphidinium_carterae.1